MRSSLTLSTGNLRQTSYERLILAYRIMVGHLLSETWLCAGPCMAEHLEGRPTSPRLPRTKNRGKSLKFWYGFPGKFCPVWIPLKPELTGFWSLHEGELIGHMLVCFPVNLVLGTLNKKMLVFFELSPVWNFSLYCGWGDPWVGASLGIRGTLRFLKLGSWTVAFSRAWTDPRETSRIASKLQCPLLK